MDINITINAGGEPEVKIKKDPMQLLKRKKRKLKNGVESVLKTPDAVNPPMEGNILNVLGI